MDGEEIEELSELGLWDDWDLGDKCNKWHSHIETRCGR